MGVSEKAIVTNYDGQDTRDTPGYSAGMTKISPVEIVRTATIAVLVVTLAGGSARAETFTLAVPPEFGEQWNLCDFSVISAGTAVSAGSALATMEQEQTLVRSLTSSDSEYTMTWTPAERGGTLTLETEYRNKFWARVFLCYWTDGNEERFLEEVTGDLVGGSLNEEDLVGPYDTLIHIVIDLCGEDVDLSESERLGLVIEEAISGDADAAAAFRSFEANDLDESAAIIYDVVYFNQSHRVIGEALRAAFTPAHPVEVSYGNRVLHVGDCDQMALFYRVRDPRDGDDEEPVEEWGETYTSNGRIYATTGDDGNIMIGYGAATDTALINLVGYTGEGTLELQASPTPGADEGFVRTFVLITRGGEGMTITDMVGSVSGTITLTPGTTSGAMSGRFEGIGFDMQGRRRNIIGGFRNVPFP